MSHLEADGLQWQKAPPVVRLVTPVSKDQETQLTKIGQEIGKMSMGLMSLSATIFEW